VNWLYRIALLALLCCLHSQPASAYSCSAASPATQSFGNVSPVSGNSYSISGTIAVTCTVAPLEGLVTGTQIVACLSIGGSSGSTPRTLANGTYSLQYNLYSDAAHTQVFGSVSSTPATPVAVNFNLGLLGILLGGSSTVNVPLYGYLPAGQISAPAGAYSQSFSGSGAALNYTGYTGATPACSGAWRSGGSFGFSVTATVINDCNLSSNNINFGSTGVLSANLFATGAVTAQCTLNDNYAIALNAGTTLGASLGDRQMAISGGGAVTHYQLYTSSAYSTVWGDGTSGTGTVAGTGNGGNQIYVVYAEVPAQTTPNPGTYSDTITATVTY
jgi:spore coat protein U-like protein